MGGPRLSSPDYQTLFTERVTFPSGRKQDSTTRAIEDFKNLQVQAVVQVSHARNELSATVVRTRSLGLGRGSALHSLPEQPVSQMYALLTGGEAPLCHLLETSIEVALLCNCPHISAGSCPPCSSRCKSDPIQPVSGSFQAQSLWF